MINKDARSNILVSNDELASVGGPVEIRHDVAPERETVYLLSSAKMKLRLISAKERCDGISLTPEKLEV